MYTRLVLIFLNIFLIPPSSYALPKTSDVMIKELPQSTEGKCLSEGSSAPDIELNLINGGVWKLSENVKKSQQILVFYRGGWCPYCNLQLRSYEKKYPDILKKGAELIAISVDKIDNSLKKPTSKLPFPVASDPDLKAIKAYNVDYKVPDELIKKYLNSYNIDIEGASGKKHHIIAIPAIVLVGKDQKIKWCYANENYKIRPAVEVILEKISQRSKLVK